MSNADDRRKLYALCSDFIMENGIHCPEDIAQVDHIIANAYDFLEEMCELIGYAEFTDEGDEPEED